MNLDEFKLLINGKANVSSRISYGKMKKIFLIANELGYDDIAIEALVTQLNNFYELQNDIHKIDVELTHTAVSDTIDVLKTQRYDKIMKIIVAMEAIPATVTQYLVISNG